MEDRISLQPDRTIGTITPELYGHFAEHLGRCIYDGIWVGPESDVANLDGLRRETVDLLRELHPPVIRWPGGCFADDYRWEDGVGPRTERPRRRNLWWVQTPERVPEESNEFGTDEFVRFCREVGAEPYLVLNVGAGSPTEAANWIEYCNYDGETEYANRRRANGNDEPYGITYWGFGNEGWGCGGRHDPDSYALACRRFANYVKTLDRFLLDEPLEFVASGHTGEGWNEQFLETLGNAVEFYDVPGYGLVDHLAIHSFFESGPDTGFTDEQYYRLFARARGVADEIDQAAAVIDRHVPESNIGVVVDEWGVWHRNCVAETGLQQENTVRDALAAAGVLDLFNERADVLTMANLAQTVNVLQCVVQTDAETAWPTPTYHVFDLYRDHAGARAIPASVTTDRRPVEKATRDVPMVSASASVSDELYVTLSNRDLDGPRRVRIEAPTNLANPQGRVAFDGLDPNECSRRENADSFAPESHAVETTPDGSLLVDVPSSSVVSIIAAIAE